MFLLIETKLHQFSKFLLIVLSLPMFQVLDSLTIHYHCSTFPQPILHYAHVKTRCGGWWCQLWRCCSGYTTKVSFDNILSSQQKVEWESVCVVLVHVVLWSKIQINPAFEMAFAVEYIIIGGKIEGKFATPSKTIFFSKSFPSHIENIK